MSQNSLLIIIAVVGYVLTGILQHFGFLPSGIDPNFIYGALTSALGVTGAVVVKPGSAVTIKPSSTPPQTTTQPINDVKG